jgi:hypothetical protein
MREKSPRSGLGITFALAMFVAAAILALKEFLAKIPRP